MKISERITFANRVKMVSPSDGLIGYIHAAKAKEMFRLRQAEIDTSLEAKLTRGGRCYVTTIYIMGTGGDGELGSAKHGGNSSKTTYEECHVVNRFLTVDVAGPVSVVMSVNHQHKYISRRNSGMYGLRHLVMPCEARG